MRYITTDYDVAYCDTCGKRLYRTWRDAAQVAERQRNRQGILVEPYHSRACDAFHVGSPRRAHNASSRHCNAPTRNEPDENVESYVHDRAARSGHSGASQGVADER